MRYHSLLLASLLALGLGAPNAANAQCVGFTDTPNDVFCPGVEWLKNRSITAGCTATEFCPSSPVSRLAMAQFMNRLGKAMTPVVLHKQHVISLQTQIPGPMPGILFCETGDYAVTGYSRTARFIGTFAATPDQDVWLQGYFRYSTDGGATWTTVGNYGVDTWPGRDWASFGQVAGATVLAPPMTLDPGTTYRFSMWLNGMNSVTPYTVHAMICQIEVTIQNANPATSPLDE